jgi:hypothetical protein
LIDDREGSRRRERQQGEALRGRHGAVRRATVDFAALLAWACAWRQLAASFRFSPHTHDFNGLESDGAPG